MKIGLVLEGGGMRGMYTAGVIDSFLDNNIHFNSVVGVSAGALFGVNYVSRQRGRALNYNIKYIRYPMYIGLRTFIKTGDIVNKDFAYYLLPRYLDIFDQESFQNSNVDFYAVVTNIDSGLSEYKLVKNVFKDMEYLRASSALPFLSNVVEINGNKYLDGGLADSIPIEKFLDEEFDKIIVVLTQPLGYKKIEINNKILYKIAEHKYGKKLAELIKNRPINYNNALEKIMKLEKENRIFVLRPSRKLNIKRLDKNLNKIKEVYNIGLKDANRAISELKDYLKY